MPKITEQQAQAIYEYGLKVIQGDVSQTYAGSQLKAHYGLNSGSATVLISNLKKMLRGERHDYSQSELVTRIFFDGILKDRGVDGLRKAISSERKSAEFQKSLGKGGRNIICDLCDKYEAKFLRG